MISMRPINAIGFGVRLLADKNASGMENIAPTTVPMKAIQIVSRRRYNTPLFVRLKRSAVSGCTIPLSMLRAILPPLVVVPEDSIAVTLQSKSATTIMPMTRL